MQPALAVDDGEVAAAAMGVDATAEAAEAILAGTAHSEVPQGADLGTQEQVQLPGSGSDERHGASGVSMVAAVVLGGAVVAGTVAVGKGVGSTAAAVTPSYEPLSIPDVSLSHVGEAASRIPPGPSGAIEAIPLARPEQVEAAVGVYGAAVPPTGSPPPQPPPPLAVLAPTVPRPPSAAAIEAGSAAAVSPPAAAAALVPLAAVALRTDPAADPPELISWLR